MTPGLPNPSTGRCGERSPERSRRIVEPSGHRNIAYLDELIAAMPTAARAIFDRIFHVSATVGQLNPPGTMRRWIEGYFGSVEAVERQRIVKITNLVTMEGSLFNELRARRPMEAKASSDLEETIMSSLGDPFCEPLEGTPADTFGRVRGKHSITASNVAKYDGFHGVVVFDEHNPLVFSAEEVSDYIDTALAWAHKAHDVDREARYFFFMWNCLWKSGASILHGHAQMTLSRDMHYAKVEHLRRSALRYREAHGANYFEDLYTVHKALGLTLENGHTRILAYLTPIKEKEVLLFSEELDQDLKDSIYKVLRGFIERLGVQSFNLALYHKPFDSTQDKPFAEAEEDWNGFPVVVRIVDRGDPNNKAADIGAMELYAASVIASDPFRVAEALRGEFISA
jgi:galactose-1-phosphate uridylyltransferase